MTITELMRLLPEQRRHVSIVPRRRGAYRPKRTWTEDELLGHLQMHDLRTTGAVRKHHAKHHDAPTVYDFVKAFGRWSVAVEKAFGRVPALLSPTPPSDADYIVKVCELYDVRSQREYLSARRTHPDIVPSSRQVRNAWGGFRNLLWACLKQSAKRTMEQYLVLERRLGHKPSALECRTAQLDLTPLRKVMGTKWTLDGLLAYRERLAGFPGACAPISCDVSLGSAPAHTAQG